MRAVSTTWPFVALGFAIGGGSALRAQTCNDAWNLKAHSGAIDFGVFDHGAGPRLYGVGGTFSSMGSVVSYGVARWASDRWESIGDLYPTEVHALEVFDDGAGPALYVGGNIYYAGGVFSPSPPSYIGGILGSDLVRFDGATWSPVDPGAFGANAAVQALCVYDDGTGPALVVGGWFPGGVPGVASASIAKWDGKTWTGLAGGIDAGGNVRDMLVWDDGTGPALYVGGYFDWAGTAPARRIAKWDGHSWHALGAGICPEPANGPVHALAIYDAGAGAALYAAGTFYGACGVPGSRAIARWDGTQWSAVAPVTYQFPAVTALLVFDDGVRGPGLIVGGDFTAIGGVNAERIARYDGSGWSGLGIGAGSWFSAMTRFDGGSTPTLWVGAAFEIGPGVWTGLGRYQYVCDPCYPDCDGSGTLTIKDFTCFQTKFVAADPEADCNASGTLTVADFSCFQTKFVAGCP